MLAIVAAVVFDDVQVTESVITTVLPSSKVPVAVKACVSPVVIDAVEGFTTMDRRLAIVTVAVVAPTIVPDVAVMLEVPAETPVTSPAVLTVATAVSDDAQVAELVMIFVLPSLYVPVAAICCVLPAVTDGVEGVTVMAVKVGLTMNPLQPTRANPHHS